MTRLQADFILLFAAVLWGLAFIFQKEAMTHVGPWTFIAARAGLAALVLTPLALLEQRREPPASDPAALRRIALLGGGCFLVASFLQQAGLITASVSNTGFLTSLYVVFTPLVAWVLSRTVPPRIVWPAIALSFTGTWLLGGGTLGGLQTGDFLVIACALFWAVHCVVTGRAAVFRRPLTFTAIQFAVVTAGATAAALVSESASFEALRAALVPILFVGLISTAFTFTIFAIAIRHTTPPEAAVILSAESLFAAAAGALLLGERLSAVSWSGAALMIAAVLLVQLAPWLSRTASRAEASG